MDLTLENSVGQTSATPAPTDATPVLLKNALVPKSDVPGRYDRLAGLVALTPGGCRWTGCCKDRTVHDRTGCHQLLVYTIRPAGVALTPRCHSIDYVRVAHLDIFHINARQRGEKCQPCLPDVLIADGVLSKVAPTGTITLEECPPGTTEEDCTERLLMPGFVNGHTHSVEHWARGLIKPLPLELW